MDVFKFLMKIIDKYLERKKRDYFIQQPEYNEDLSSKLAQIGWKNPLIHNSLYESQEMEGISNNEEMHQNKHFILYFSEEGNETFADEIIRKINNHMQLESFMKDLMRSAFEK